LIGEQLAEIFDQPFYLQTACGLGGARVRRELRKLKLTEPVGDDVETEPPSFMQDTIASYTQRVLTAKQRRLIVKRSETTDTKPTHKITGSNRVLSPEAEG